jgi:hypothetical protein
MAEMPEIKSAILIPRGGHLPHDTDGKLLRMGHEATALVFGAQHLPTGHPRKRQLFEQARAMRLEERQGWLAVRTSEFPAGDLEGAAKASLAIATYHLELQELEKGREWLAKALEEAPKDKALVRAAIEHNMSIVKQIMQAFSASSTPVQSGRSSPVQGAGGVAGDHAHTSSQLAEQPAVAAHQPAEGTQQHAEAAEVAGAIEKLANLNLETA